MYKKPRNYDEVQATNVDKLKDYLKKELNEIIEQADEIILDEFDKHLKLLIDKKRLQDMAKEALKKAVRTKDLDC